MRFYRYRRRMTRRALVRLALVILTALALGLTVVAVTQMKSLLTRLAVTKVSNTVNRIVSEAVNSAMAEGNFQYERMITFEKNNEGTITALKSNMPEFNHLQSAVLNDVLERISEVSTRDLGIPVGSLTGSSLLAGRGPRVTVRMQSVGSSSAWLGNEFTSAGINQTKHRILLHVDVFVSVLLPGFSAATKVENTLTVAETIIVGSVPQSYTYFQSDDPLEEDAEQFILNGN